MRTSVSIALVGDYDPSVPAHQAIPLALQMSAAHYDKAIRPVWVGTSEIRSVASDLRSFDAIWCVPASPYRNTAGALDAIRHARKQQIPFLGTCGGFQHALLEFAQNELGIANPTHAELEPNAPDPLIGPLSCSLDGEGTELVLHKGSCLHRCYGTSRIVEQYRCSYGPTHKYEKVLFSGRFQPTAHDEEGQVRAAELGGHPFFIGTLFQPERRALTGQLPPLVLEFVHAALTASVR